MIRREHPMIRVRGVKHWLPGLKSAIAAVALISAGQWAYDKYEERKHTEKDETKSSSWFGCFYFLFGVDYFFDAKRVPRWPQRHRFDVAGTIDGWDNRTQSASWDSMFFDSLSSKRVKEGWWRLWGCMVVMVVNTQRFDNE
jgi:hypothetical protein